MRHRYIRQLLNVSSLDNATDPLLMWDGGSFLFIVYDLMFLSLIRKEMSVVKIHVEFYSVLGII